MPKATLGANQANGVRAWAGSIWNWVQTAGRIATSRITSVGRTPAGVYIDAEESLKNDVVWACIQYLSRTVAQLPWRVFLEGGRGPVPAPTSPADWLIWKRPNPEMGSFSFRQTLMYWVLRYGNGYAEIERDNRGAPYALWPIHPERVRPVRNPETGVLEYEVSNPSAGVTPIPARDMLHIRGFGDGPVGFNVIEYAAQSIGWAQATQIFGATFFGEGMNPSGVVTTKKSLTPPAASVLRSELERLYKGPKGKRTVILDADMDFKKLATNPNDAQFVEAMQHQVAVICRWFGVPPHKVMHLLNATFSNIEHQSIEVVVDAITPWVKVWEEEADYKLFGAQNRLGYYTKMNLKGLLRGDNASRAAYYKERFYAGSLSPNEIRALEDEATLGPEGDAYFVPVNMQTLERAITAVASSPAAAADAANSADPSSATPKASLNGAVLQH